MSLLNEAYRLQYTGGNETASEAKKRKALAHLDETIERAEHAHQAKRAKAEAEFRENPQWCEPRGTGRKRYYEPLRPGHITNWQAVRKGECEHLYRRLGMTLREARDQWLLERGLAPLSEEEEPCLDTLVRRHVDETVGKEAVVPLTTALLASIRDACA